ncbi:hypothetical protein DPX16_6385 [Anabarilius grahami]|uniref:PiggyBac transposable element-derived protein domain-containing protein n=1 Tax=Anabarilius grahami TaxID=495550 RepID=A0A3N0XH05_ANAGA|nr:hypothetical protein DPX16_6385 [Anabarilius grahami]
MESRRPRSEKAVQIQFIMDNGNNSGSLRSTSSLGARSWETVHKKSSKEIQVLAENLQQHRGSVPGLENLYRSIFIFHIDVNDLGKRCCLSCPPSAAIFSLKMNWKMNWDLVVVFSTTAATLTPYAPKRKKTVYILSSMHSVIQTDNTTKRKPNTVTLYNTTKCGVDVMDQMVQEYTVRTGTRRWPVAVFYNMIDMAALNAHVLYQACIGRQERQVDFLVELARELANSHMCAKKARKEQLLRTQPSTPSPGKRAMCQVKHQCKNNHATVRCVHCYRLW